MQNQMNRDFFTELKTKIIQKLEDNKAEDIVFIDLNNKSNIAYYLIIASSLSARHSSALAEHLADEIKKYYKGGVIIEGLGSTSWTLLDVNGIIVHIFQPEARKIYDIEGLYGVIKNENLVALNNEKFIS